MRHACVLQRRAVVSRCATFFHFTVYEMRVFFPRRYRRWWYIRYIPCAPVGGIGIFNMASTMVMRCCAAKKRHHALSVPPSQWRKINSSARTKYEIVVVVHATVCAQRGRVLLTTGKEETRQQSAHKQQNSQFKKVGEKR